jgi:hypothetical protein
MSFAALGGSMLWSLRSPRTWDSHRIGLGSLVDDDAGAKNRLPGPQMRQPVAVQATTTFLWGLHLELCTLKMQSYNLLAQ